MECLYPLGLSVRSTVIICYTIFSLYIVGPTWSAAPASGMVRNTAIRADKIPTNRHKAFFQSPDEIVLYIPAKFLLWICVED
jgi:hypothetical protein